MARRTKRKLDAGLLLLLTPVLWGATFPGTKIALRRLPVVPFMAWSRILGLAAILVLLPLLRRATPEPRRRVRAVLVPGAILGALMFLGYFLQTEGLARTTATNAGFITGLYVVFTPILGLLAFAHRPPRSAWAAVLMFILIGAAGAWSSTILSLVYQAGWVIPKFILFFLAVGAVIDALAPVRPRRPGMA